MKTIYLVTGAAGYLGNVIVGRLAAEGCDVRALVLPGDPAAAKLPGRVEICTGDLLDPEALERFFDTGADTERIVIHSAGIVSTTSSFSQAMYDVNVTGTKRIVDQCFREQVRKLVYVSSVHAMPVLPKGQRMAETTVFSPEKVNGPYAKTKAEATAYVFEAVRKGLDASVVFPAGICGPGSYGNGHMVQLLVDYCRGRLPAGVRGGFDFVDVRDVADGVISCCRNGKKGEGYILSGRYVSVREMLDLFHRETGRKKTKWFLPIWVARIFVPFFWMHYRLWKKTPLFSGYSLYTLRCNADFSHDKASKELGYSVRPFPETVADTVKWMIRAGRIRLRGR